MSKPLKKFAVVGRCYEHIAVVGADTKPGRPIWPPIRTRRLELITHDQSSSCWSSSRSKRVINADLRSRQRADSPMAPCCCQLARETFEGFGTLPSLATPNEHPARSMT